MYCENCGKEVDDNAESCGSCGHDTTEGEAAEVETCETAATSPEGAAPAAPLGIGDATAGGTNAAKEEPAAGGGPASAPAPSDPGAKTAQAGAEGDRAEAREADSPASSQRAEAAPGGASQAEDAGETESTGAAQAEAREADSPASSQRAEAAPTPTGQDAPSAAQPSADAAATQPAADAAAPAATAAASGFFAKVAALPKKKKIGVLGAAAALIVAAIVIAAFVMIKGNTVPLDKLKQDLTGTSVVSKGVVPSAYVEDSPYELSDLKIDEQHDESGSMFGVTIKAKTLSFSGTVKNANFETSFTGNAAYTKQGDSWAPIVSPTVTSSHTTPLKGVDKMDVGTSFGAGKYTVTDFQSSLDENQGSYTSTAVQTVKYEQWFADDTAKNTIVFAFDEKGGWKPKDSKAAVSDVKTDWKLKGKTFSLNKARIFYDGTSDSSLTFKESQNDTLSADYSFTFTNKEKDSSFTTYHDISLSGTLTGTVQHEVGSPDFKVELNDPANKVTMKLSNSYSTTIAGTGSVNALDASIDTDSVYSESTLGSTTRSSTFSVSSMTYTEKA